MTCERLAWFYQPVLCCPKSRRNLVAASLTGNSDLISKVSQYYAKCLKLVNWNNDVSFSVVINKSITPYRKAFASPGTKTIPDMTGLLFTHKNGDVGAISVTERCCTALIFRGDSHILDRRAYVLRIGLFVGRVGRLGKREKWKRAVYVGKEEQREGFSSSHRTYCYFYFCYFYWKTKGAPL